MSDLLKRLDNARRGLCTENPEEYMATGLTVADALQAAARIREQRALLDECEKAFQEIINSGGYRGSVAHAEFVDALSRRVLHKLAHRRA